MFEEPQRLSLVDLLGVTRYWPPFFHLASVPFTFVLGFSVASVAATNFLFLVVLVCSVFQVGRRLFGESVGVGAVVLTLLYPIVYALSRTVLIDFALMAMVMLSLQLILSSDAGLDWSRSAWLGAAAGAAMLTKWTAVTFLLGPAVLCLVLAARRRRPSALAALLSVGLGIAVAALVALPWYATNFEPFVEHAHVAFGSDPAQEGDPVRLLDSLRWYWAVAEEALLLKPLLAATLAGLVLFVARVGPGFGMAFLLSSILPALGFFLLIPNKDARFVAPLLPAVAIMVAAGLQSVPWKSVRTLAWAGIVAVGVYQFYAISFGWPATVAHFYTGPPQTADWKVSEVLTEVSTLAEGEAIWIAVLPNDPDFEPNLFHLASAVARLPLHIDAVGHEREPIEAWRRYRAIISKTGSVAVPHAVEFRAALRDDLAAWMAGPNTSPHVSLWRTWPLPDGSRAEVYVFDDRPRPPSDGAPADRSVRPPAAARR
jgi:4-amino-4-deoxy-L-arabinose transferase-like glycosyltransferase